MNIGVILFFILHIVAVKLSPLYKFQSTSENYFVLSLLLVYSIPTFNDVLSSFFVWPCFCPMSEMNAPRQRKTLGHRNFVEQNFKSRIVFFVKWSLLVNNAWGGHLSHIPFWLFLISRGFFCPSKVKCPRKIQNVVVICLNNIFGKLQHRRTVYRRPRKLCEGKTKSKKGL